MEERSQVNYDAKLNVSDLSHGSVYEKKEKFISTEAKNHIYNIVDKVAKKNSQGIRFSKSFMSAYPELNDLCNLYGKPKQKKVKEKDRVRLQTIARKITDKYRKHDEEMLKEVPKQT